MVLVRHRMRGDDRGVASTVGTIMALLVFLTFLSLIVNQYVPVWMTDSESSHMGAALGQFGDFKSAIDLQVMAAIMAHNAGSVYVPSTTSTAVTLGVDGIPIFTSSTTGQLALSQSLAAWTLGFTYVIKSDFGSQSVAVLQNASGSLELLVANRFSASGNLGYENGAVIRSQYDGQVLRAQPIFQVARSGSNLSVAFELISLFGSGSVSGTSAEVVNTRVYGVNQQTYTGLTSSITITHASAYGPAWFDFFNSTLATALSVPASDRCTPSYCYNPGPGSTTITTTYYQIVLTSNPTTGIYSVTLTIYNGPLTPNLTLQQAYVNVGFGQGSTSTT